jgi:hypothetical protein
MSPVRGISYFLIGFAAVCWVGAAWVGITNAGSEVSADSIRVLNMFTGVATTSALLAIALGIWLKD